MFEVILGLESGSVFLYQVWFLLAFVQFFFVFKAIVTILIQESIAKGHLFAHLENLSELQMWKVNPAYGYFIVSVPAQSKNPGTPRQWGHREF